MSRRQQKNPKYVLAALAASSVLAVSYKIYDYYTAKTTGGAGSNNKSRESTSGAVAYTSKSIALTLSHSILSSQLPLHDILLNADNVTFILPPNLSIDDLAGNIVPTSENEIDDNSESYTLPRSLLNNYKLLNCNNFQGYFNIIKNLRPDMLLVCSDDLGLSDGLLPKELNRFVKQVVNVDQNSDDVTSKIGPIFLR